MISQQSLKQTLNYDEKTGIFTRLTSAGGLDKGAVCGWSDPRGYIRIRVKGGQYWAHRLAWLYIYGSMPGLEIDHINQIKDDNRIANLRDVSKTTNLRNSTMSRNNSSGFTGVCWHKASGKWRAQIEISGKRVHLGLFTDKEDAITARKQANKERNFHPNHGTPKPHKILSEEER